MVYVVRKEVIKAKSQRRNRSENILVYLLIDLVVKLMVRI